MIRHARWQIILPALRGLTAVRSAPASFGRQASGIDHIFRRYDGCGAGPPEWALCTVAWRHVYAASSSGCGVRWSI